MADCLIAWVDGSGPGEVTVGRGDRYLVVTLTGVPACHADVMADHAEAMGGSIEVQNVEVPNGGTITVRIPCA